MLNRMVQSVAFAWLLMAGGILLFAGCATVSREAIMYHALDYPVRPKGASAAVPHTVMIYRFLLGPEVDPDYLVVTGPQSKEQAVRAHRWSRSPADMITDLIERDLSEAGIFEKTVGQFSPVRYRYALEGTVLEMKGVQRGGKATASITVKATLTDFGVPLGADKTILKRTYPIEIESKDAGPEAIVEALNRAVGRLSQELIEDISAAVRGKSQAVRQRSQEASPKVRQAPSSNGSAFRR
ncbi:MAG: ABC-type transport auxiliary lipoprotein family protein [Desulfomonile sp.]|nr:ABC-type transport auxiliary lipoprotein family protein [Desulfomonile sp.]